MCIEKVFINMRENSEIISFSLRNSKGFGIDFLNLGGVITDILVPDKKGNIENVVLKYEDLETYVTNPSYYGAIVGRTAGRIANGTTKLNDEVLTFNKNYGVNQGHGGPNGFTFKIFNVEVRENENEVSALLSYYSKDGEEGYPGNLKVNIIYTINENNEFKITYKAISDKDTLVNLTNHSYFNLSGSCKEDILDHYLYVNSDFLIELNNNQVPTGRLLYVENTPFDFNIAKKIGRDINSDDPQLAIGQGYDHPWILNPEGNLKLRLVHKESGRVMDVYTNQKSVVLYTLNFPDDKTLACGRKANKRDAIAIETQSPPIGENNIFTKYSILRKGEEYFKETVYKFSILEEK